jgi:phosphatidylserine decarboxylase
MADQAVGIPIVKEGLPFVLGAAGATALGGALGFEGVLVGFGCLTLFIVWFFRNPHREIPKLVNGLVSPGDGKVIAIEREFEPRYLKAESIRVSIFLNVFDVHVNRVPCDGVVEGIAYQPGKFVAANRPEATLRNEQNALMIQTPSGAKVLCVQVAGLIARRIVCWLSIGASVGCGERYGLIRFGSRMDVFVPIGTKLHVSVGQTVKGGSSLLGELP